MFLSYSELRAIIEAKPNGRELVDWISDQAYHVYRVKKDLEELDLEEKVLKSQFKTHLAKIQRRRCEIRERCRHFSVDAHLDSSGKEYGYGRCVICGDRVVKI